MRKKGESAARTRNKEERRKEWRVDENREREKGRSKDGEAKHLGQCGHAQERWVRGVARVVLCFSSS